MVDVYIYIYKWEICQVHLISKNDTRCVMRNETKINVLFTIMFKV